MLKLIEKTTYALVAGFTIFGMGLNASAAKQETISTSHYFQVTNTQLQDIKKTVEENKKIVYDKNRTKQIMCMLRTLIGEASSESMLGKQAAGEIIVNRAKSKRYSNTVCEVVHEYKQFSMYNNDSKNKANLKRTDAFMGAELSKKEPSWKFMQTLLISKRLIDGDYKPILPVNSYNYHAHYVKPNWRSDYKKVVSIDNHIFYMTKAP